LSTPSVPRAAILPAAEAFPLRIHSNATRSGRPPRARRGRSKSCGSCHAPHPAPANAPDS
jgi:hypothetical protein